MGFLDRLRTPSYGVNGNPAYAYTPVGREDLEAMRPMMSDPDPAPVNIPMPRQSGVGMRGMFGPANRGNEFGPGGQNITGFGQTDQNVVYDQRPEQFAEEVKLRKRALDIQEKQVDALSGLKQYDADTRRMNAGTAAERNDIARFRAENPNMILRPGASTWLAIDPQSGQVIDTGMSTGKMTESARIAAQQEGRVDLANINNTAAAGRATTMADAMRERAAMGNQGDIAEILTRAIAQATTKGNETPSMSDQAARAQQYLNEHPEMREFIKISPDGKGVIVAKPIPQEGSGQTSNPGGDRGGSILSQLASAFGRKQTGPTEMQWRDANKFIYEPRVDPAKIIQNTGNISSPFMTQNPTINAGGKIEGGGPSGGDEFVMMEFPDKTRRKVKKSEVQKYSQWGKVVQ